MSRMWILNSYAHWWGGPFTHKTTQNIYNFSVHYKDTHNPSEDCTVQTRSSQPGLKMNTHWVPKYSDNSDMNGSLLRMIVWLRINGMKYHLKETCNASRIECKFFSPEHTRCLQNQIYLQKKTKTSCFCDKFCLTGDWLIWWMLMAQWPALFVTNKPEEKQPNKPIVTGTNIISDEPTVIKVHVRDVVLEKRHTVVNVEERDAAG